MKKNKIIKELLWGSMIFENVIELKLPRKMKKWSNKLMMGDGYCLHRGCIPNKHSIKLINICNKCETHFKIGSHLFCPNIF